jgi:hypothetical protein
MYVQMPSEKASHEPASRGREIAGNTGQIEGRPLPLTAAGEWDWRLRKGSLYTHPMSKRLQVLLPDTEMQEIRRIARRDKIPVGEWVRRALRAARSREPVHAPDVKLKAIRDAAKLAFPSGDIETMLAEIEQGYQS